MTSPGRRWLPVLLWILVIYTTIPFVRALREWYVARWDPAWIGRAVAAVLVAAAVSALVVLGRRMGRLPTRTIVWVAGITTVSVLWTASLRRSPEEAVHFLEYGMLAVLLYRALRPSMHDVLVFAAGALIGSLVGTMDEVIQWLSPGRYWDWRDLALNAGAGALTQLVIWRIAPVAHRPVDPASVRLVLRLAAAQLAFLTVCLANTPARVARFSPYLPGSDHLTSSINPMAEYGHRHVDPEIGVFASRLTLEDLRHEDTTRATEVAACLDENRHSYSRFLDTWPVDRDPFTYEARVHLFARDRNLAKARAQDFTGGLATHQLTVAWHENRLLEVWFSTTLDASSYLWRPGLRRRVEAGFDPESPFSSAAGSHLITIASEGTIRTVLLLLVGLLIFADHRTGRSMARRSWISRSRRRVQR